MGDIAQRGNRLTFAKGGRAGHSLGHTAGRRLTKTLERLGGGPEGKPHSTRAGRIAAGVRKIKRGAKSWNKKDFKGSDEVRALLKGLRPKKPSTHGKDIPTMATQGGRAGKAAGGRIGKDIGGSIKKIAKTAAKRWKKKKVYPETEDLTHQVGPYVGDVGSERPGIKRRGWGKKPGQKKPDREHVPYERHGAKKGGRAGKAIGGITKISKILKQTFKPRGRKPGVLDKVIGKGVVDKNVKSKELKKLLEKSKARSKERVAESKLKKKWLKGK